MASRKPRIKPWDIETGFMQVGVHDLYPNFISHKNIITDKYIICASWKDLKKDKMYSVSVNPKDPLNDQHVIEVILDEMMENADAIVHHNGDKFDLRVFNSRVIYHGYEPYQIPVKIDTLKMARQMFKFQSNRLDHLGDYLGVGHKMRTPEGLWMDCLHGKPNAIKQMVKYNRRDVILLEDVFDILRPWLPPKLNFQLFTGQECCPDCGSINYILRGERYAKVRKYHQYYCKDCTRRWDGKPFK